MDDKLALLEVRSKVLNAHIVLTNTVHHAQKEYCPPIDSSLFSAIVLDYDLLNSESYKQLSTTLDELKAAALAEENTSFDPSGSSGVQQDAHISEGSSDPAHSWHGDIASSSSATEDTDLESSPRDLERIHIENFLNDEATNALSDQQKVAALKEIFPEIKVFDIEWTLRKTHFNFGRTVEELLNQAFLDEEGLESGAPLVKRGIDGFSESTLGPRRRKKKGRKGQALTGPFTDRPPDATPPSSKWDRVREDIEFLEQRTFISREVISSKYHSCGTSLPSAIIALISSERPNANPYITADLDPVLEMHTVELASEFPSLSYAQLSGLVRLSHPSTASARELAYALVSLPSSTPASKIFAQYLPRPPSPDEALMPNNPSTSALNPSTAAALANTRGKAFMQAQSAYRKSKSNPHFGGAAAYYIHIGRDACVFLLNHEAASAEELVASQSKPGELDLHGVSSRDAVRISKDKVNGWWISEAQEWSRTGKSRDDFRIVTGQGHHSSGGKGVLGPVVFKALMAEGWKVRMEQGYIVISGRVKK